MANINKRLENHHGNLVFFVGSLIITIDIGSYITSGSSSSRSQINFPADVVKKVTVVRTSYGVSVNGTSVAAGNSINVNGAACSIVAYAWNNVSNTVTIEFM